MYVLISSCKSTKITNSYRTTINRRMLELKGKKDMPCPATKEKPQWNSRRGTIMIKAKPILSRWLTYRLEKNNTKEVDPLLWRLSPMWGFPVWGSRKGITNPQGTWRWRPEGLDCRTSTGLGETDTLTLKDTDKTLCAPGPRGKE